MHYLDNAATTQIHPDVADVVQQTLRTHWANPSALYAPGMAAEAVIEAARGTLAEALGCQPREVFFTASGTESNNIALLGAARARKAWANHLVTTGYEHPSAQKLLAMLARHEGFELTEINPGPDGRVDMQAMADAVGPKTALVCAMQVNNETGALLDVAALAEAVKAKNARCFVHVDGVQAFGKLPVNLRKTKIDGFAVSGHKLHAPKGVGALYLRDGINILPPFAGGGQEADSQHRSIRPGTENTAFIAGFGKAVELAMARRAGAYTHIAQLREQFLAAFTRLKGTAVHSPADGWPGTVFISMPAGFKSQVMLEHLYNKFGICVSSGSACSGGAASHTLTAMGVPAAQIDAALRISFCADNTPEDVDILLRGLRDCLTALARGCPE
ncbi:MAG: cysteine desulfurase [Ruminococcaceae bacterium]|nr:cysteine desulfurase [Oscillospiraceae bacterium]